MQFRNIGANLFRERLLAAAETLDPAHDSCVCAIEPLEKAGE